MELSDKDLKDQTTLKIWLKKNKINIKTNQTQKIKLSKCFYLYVSKLTTGDYSFKFIYRTSINGKQKDLRLNSKTYYEALLEKAELKDSFNQDIVIIPSVWEEFIKSSKYEKLAENSKRTLLSCYKKYFSSDIAQMNKINLLNLNTESAFCFLNTIISKKTVPVINICINLLNKIIECTENMYNKFIEVDLRKVKQKLKQGISYQVKHRDTFTGYKRNLEELEHNITELYRALDRSHIKKQNKLAIDLLLYSCLRESELLSITINDLYLNEPDINYLHIKETKTIKNGSGFNIPITESIKMILIEAIELKITDTKIFNISLNGFGQSIKMTLNKYIEPNNIIGETKRITGHGFRSLAREFFNLNEDKIPFKTAENCLSHKVGNQVINSYLRDQLQGLPQDRIKAMKLWSDFLDKCKLKADSKLATKNIKII